MRKYFPWNQSNQGLVNHSVLYAKALKSLLVHKYTSLYHFLKSVSLKCALTLDTVHRGHTDLKLLAWNTDLNWL